MEEYTPGPNYNPRHGLPADWRFSGTLHVVMVVRVIDISVSEALPSQIDGQALSTEALGEYLRVFERLEAKYHEGCGVASTDEICQLATDSVFAKPRTVSLFVRPRTFSAGSAT